MALNKKAGFDNWPESYFWILLVLGLLMTLMLRNSFLANFIIFLCGMGSGRLFYFRKKQAKSWIYILLVGFLIGYLLGSFYTSRLLLFIVFVIGNLLSYYLHKKKYL